jgi:hypothetical protein
MKESNKVFSSFKNFISEKSDIELTPRQKISEIGKKQGELKNKIAELQSKKREHPEQRAMLDLQAQLTNLKIQEMDIQRKIMTMKL